MQIMPATGRDLARITGVEGPLTSPGLNVLYGNFYMRQQLRIWYAPRTLLERLELAQASYNAGAGRILKAQKLSGDKATWELIQPFLVQVTGHHSKETTNYVRLIKKWYDQLVVTRRNLSKRHGHNLCRNWGIYSGSANSPIRQACISSTLAEIPR